MRRGLVLAAVAISLVSPAATQSVDITSPSQESWQNTSFDVGVDDDNVASCAYRVRDGGTWTGKQSRTCSGDFNIDLSTDCTTTGFRSCEVNVSATNSTGYTVYERRNFSIGSSPCPDATACWTFEEGSGQMIYDRSGNGFHAVLGNTSGVDEYDPQWTTECARPGSSCLNFTDNDADEQGNEFIRVIGKKNAELEGVSLVADINPTSLNNSAPRDMAIISKEFSFKLAVGSNQTTANRGELIAATYNSSVCPGGWCGDDTSDNWERSGFVMPSFGWNKIGYAFNTTHYKFYSNGRLVAVEGTTKIGPGETAEVSENPYPISAGARDPTSAGFKPRYFFRGVIDDARVYNRSVDLSDVGSCNSRTAGTYRDAEQLKNTQRLIDDLEYCKQDSSGTYWVDQDYEKNACRHTWVSASEVDRNPNAFTGGIDDDYSMELDKNFVSKPAQMSYGAGESPVHTGDLDKSRNISTKGFCLGDDGGENRVTQVCRSSLCETNRSVTAASVSPKSCAFENNGNIRVFSQGENRSFSGGTIACFGGVFYSNWPVSAVESNVDVVEGRSNTVQFQIVNVENMQRRFQLSKEGEAANLASFYDLPEDGEVVVPPNSAVTVSLEVFGSQEFSGGQDLTVQAVSRSGEVSGTDTVNIQLKSQNYESEPNSVPGISTVHFLIVGAAATLLLFQSSAL